ncbi:MAG: hypothetical protein ACKO37_00975 [Vampirovibrionales bacterium]
MALRTLDVSVQPCGASQGGLLGLARDPGGMNMLLGVLTQVLETPPWQWTPKEIQLMVTPQAKARCVLWGVAEGCFLPEDTTPSMLVNTTRLKVWSATSLNASWEVPWWQRAYHSSIECHVVIDQPRHLRERFQYEVAIASRVQKMHYALSQLTCLYGSEATLQALQACYPDETFQAVSFSQEAHPWYRFLKQFLSQSVFPLTAPLLAWTQQLPVTSLSLGIILEPFSLRDPIHCEKYGSEWDNVITYCKAHEQQETAQAQQTKPYHALLKPHPYHTETSLQEGLHMLSLACPAWQFHVCPQALPAEWLLQGLQAGYFPLGMPWCGVASSVLDELALLGARVYKSFPSSDTLP